MIGSRPCKNVISLGNDNLKDCKVEKGKNLYSHMLKYETLFEGVFGPKDLYFGLFSMFFLIFEHAAVGIFQGKLQ